MEIKYENKDSWYIYLELYDFYDINIIKEIKYYNYDNENATDIIYCRSSYSGFGYNYGYYCIFKHNQDYLGNIKKCEKYILDTYCEDLLKYLADEKKKLEKLNKKYEEKLNLLNFPYLVNKRRNEKLNKIFDLK